jgi:hypothetical protein
MSTTSHDQSDAHDRIGDSPAALVAIARAAHVTGDRDLERAARNALIDQWGIRIVFTRAAMPVEVAK